MNQKILIFLSLDQNKIKKSSCVLTHKLSDLSEQLDAQVIGVSIGNQEISDIDTQNILVDYYYHMKLEEGNLYNINSCHTEILNLVRELEPMFIIGVSSSMESELFPWIAAAFQLNMISNCKSIELSNGEVMIKRNIYGGKVDAYLKLHGKPPYILTFINVNHITNEKVKNIKSKQLSCKIISDLWKGITLNQSNPNDYEQDISDSSIVIAGGRGLKNKENFESLTYLSKLLGAATGASRAIVDEGIAPNYMQVGQTGKSISPDFYIAFGISGAEQHLAGMSNSRTIIAINNNPEAQIFRVAHYGIVCDAEFMLKEMICRIEKEIS